MEHLLKFIANRKRNITFFIISIPIIKVLIHYFVYPIKKKRIGRMIDLTTSRDAPDINPIYVYGDNDNMGIDVHIKLMFEKELILFIPSVVILMLIIWLFNDKIKAR